MEVFLSHGLKLSCSTRIVFFVPLPSPQMNDPFFCSYFRSLKAEQWNRKPFSVQTVISASTRRSRAKIKPFCPIRKTSVIWNYQTPTFPRMMDSTPTAGAIIFWYRGINVFFFCYTSLPFQSLYLCAVFELEPGWIIRKRTLAVSHCVICGGSLKQRHKKNCPRTKR